MLSFHIQPSGEIPAYTQLVKQISFAIACGQYAPGYRLPSTRQLAMQTGLHRNTISKVYHELEQMGLVESRAGSGIYVTASEQAVNQAITTRQLTEQTQAYQWVKQGLDQLLKSGCSLSQARDLFLAEIDWRLRCSAQVLVVVPTAASDTGKLIAAELQRALTIPIERVPIEELEPLLAQTQTGTIVTIRYFANQVEDIAQRWSVRVLPLEINPYHRELDMIKNLPANTCLGLISVSLSILQTAEVLLHALRGDDLLVLVTDVADLERVEVLVRRCQVIFCDSLSYSTVKALIRKARSDLIRLPQLIQADDYVSHHSIEMLKRELGLATDPIEV